MIKIAILSFAHYHANFWTEAFQAESGVRVSAIWDRDAARGQEAAGRFKLPFVADLDAAIAGADAVAVCSETIEHGPLIERAARAGRAVLCEKPLAANLTEATRIATAVKESGITFMQSFPKRFDPVSHAVRQLVGDGVLGRIGLVRIRHGHSYGFDPDFKQRWYVDPTLSGGGALLDEGIHAADFLRWLFGRPRGVVASVSSALGLKVEDLGVAVFDYDDGMIAEIASSFSFAAADASIEIYGAEGTALVSGVDLASRDITTTGFLRVYRRTQPDKAWRIEPVTPRFKLGQFHHQNAIEFARALRSKTRPPITLADGLAALTMIMRAYDAARTGTRQIITSDT